MPVQSTLSWLHWHFIVHRLLSELRSVFSPKIQAHTQYQLCACDIRGDINKWYVSIIRNHQTQNSTRNNSHMSPLCPQSINNNVWGGIHREPRLESRHLFNQASSNAWFHGAVLQGIQQSLSETEGFSSPPGAARAGPGVGCWDQSNNAHLTFHSAAAATASCLLVINVCLKGPHIYTEVHTHASQGPVHHS